MAIAFGEPIPLGDEHALGVSLPEWRHSVGFSRKDPQVMGKLKSGYPRFNIHEAILNLEDRLVTWAASKPVRGLAVVPEEAVKLFPSDRMARGCHRHLEKVEEAGYNAKAVVRITRITLDGALQEVTVASTTCKSLPEWSVYVVIYPSRLERAAFQFWLHTGHGISSRFAAFWLDNASFLQPGQEHIIGSWVHSLPVEKAMNAADAIKRHLASLYSTEDAQATIDDVFLFQGGMSAIAQMAEMIQTFAADRLGGQKGHRVALVGFLYVDTLKVLSKILGFQCDFYGHGSAEDLDALEAQLKAGERIYALYTEFPTNPLLKLVDLERLHTLAIEHDFILIVDDTISTPVNLLLAPFCDIVCTSLSKMYSGTCNVMGGSVVVSPWSRHRAMLQATLAAQYEDTLFPLDVLTMRENSAKFEARVVAANHNAQRVAERLRGHRLVDKVLYPRGSTSQAVYDRFMRPGAGYGFVLSVYFSQPSAAVAFHDALDLAKGPSFGTNFTLACPYTVLAHYTELEWASQHGVLEHLVRISVGTEQLEVLYGAIDRALAIAEALPN